MAPNLRDSTSIDMPTSWVYTVSTTARSSNQNNTNYTGTCESGGYWISVTTREDEKKYIKLLKRMADDMCKNGWFFYPPKYTQPKLQPISLRGVRLDGRGWAN